jgi:hypothetical protein
MPRSLNIIFGLLFLTFGISLAGWAFVYAEGLHLVWVEEWAPHVAAVSIELFVGAAVVDRLLRRQETRLLEPRREIAFSRLGRAFSRLVTGLNIQYAYLSSTESPPARDRLITAWTEALKGAMQGWLPQWLSEVDAFVRVLDDVVDRYGLILDSETVARIEGLVQSWNQEVGLRLRLSYELASAAAVSLGSPSPDQKPLTEDQILLMHQGASEAFLLLQRLEQSPYGLEVDISDLDEQFRLAQMARVVAPI